MSEKIIFFDVDTNEEIEFYVVEETRINNMNYLLVTEEDDTNQDSDEESVAYILKDLSEGEDAEARYVMVDDDDELTYVSKIFGELLGDVQLDCE